MKRRTRILYTESQKALMWDRWEKGDSLQQIGQMFNRHHPSIAGIFSKTGGIRPTQRCRSERSLTLPEREEISRSIVDGQSIRSIAKRLNRPPSTVSRELSRNGGREAYRANTAYQAAWDRATRPKVCKLVANRALANAVAAKLKLQWAPEQIAGWLKHAYPGDENNQVSHETISAASTFKPVVRLRRSSSNI